MTNIALSALDEHYARAWEAMGSTTERAKRRRHGEANYRLVRYADLSRCPHKSAYAESLVMPSRGWDRPWLLGLGSKSSA